MSRHKLEAATRRSPTQYASNCGYGPLTRTVRLQTAGDACATRTFTPAGSSWEAVCACQHTLPLASLLDRCGSALTVQRINLHTLKPD